MTAEGAPPVVGGRILGGAIAVQVSPAEREAQAHNLARYHELQKLRRGQANTYNETRYR